MFGPETSPPLPWTDEQVAALNRYQESGQFHPFTCGSGNRMDEAHSAAKERFGLSDHGALIATRTGWICPACDYRQEWAHAAMFVSHAPAAVGREPSEAMVEAARDVSNFAWSRMAPDCDETHDSLTKALLNLRVALNVHDAALSASAASPETE